MTQGLDKTSGQDVDFASSTPLKPRTVFVLILFVCSLMILLTFRDYGITTDEEGHIAYGSSVIAWYASAFEDRRIFSWTNTWLYGGFYDVVSFAFMKAAPLHPFDARHLCNALFGMLGILAAYRIGCLLGSGWIGVLAALFLILTPRYYGHTFNNHKDIPFAVLYLWSLYWQLKVMQDLPQARWQTVLVAGVVTGLAMGVRVGGVLLIGYAALFWGVRYGQLIWHEKGMIWDFGWRYMKQVAAVSVVAYIVMLTFWPWAQTDPLRHPFVALISFSRFSDIQSIFFDGRYVLSTALPGNYIPEWLLVTLPAFVLFGIGPGAVFWAMRVKKGGGLDVLLPGLVLFGALFPLCYAGLSQMALYSGLRHLLFAMPPLILISATGWFELLNRFSGRIRQGGLVVLLGLLAATAWEMGQLHPYQYIYFNSVFGGGLDRAALHYETDYWQTSHKEGVEWLHQNARQIAFDRKIQVTSDNDDIRFLLDHTRFVYVENPWQADYFLVSTTHERHRVVPGRIVHEVRAKQTPLLFVVQPDSAFAGDPLFAGSSAQRKGFLGALYKKIGQKQAALEAYRDARQLNPDDSGLDVEIGVLLLDLGQPELARDHLLQARNAGYEDADVLWKLGLCYEHLDALALAEDFYRQALMHRPHFLQVHRALGALYRKQGRHADAVAHFQHVVDILPESINDWHALASCLYDMGRKADAEAAYQMFLKHKTKK